MPLGLSVSQLFFLGNQRFSAPLGACCNVVRPDIGPEWQLRFQISLQLPK